MYYIVLEDTMYVLRNNRQQYYHLPIHLGVKESGLF